MSEKKGGKARNVGSMGFGYFVNSAQEVSLPLLFPTLKNYFYPVLGNTHLAIIDGVRVIVQTFISPLWGMASDRFSRRRVLMFGTGLWGSLVIFCGLATEFWHLFAGWVIACLGIGALVPAGFGLLADLYGPHERGKAIGILNAIGMSGIVIGALGLGVLMGASEQGVDLGFFKFNQASGWRIGFIIIGVLSVMASLAMGILIREPSRGSAEPELDEALADLAAARFRFKVEDVKKILINKTMLLAFVQGFFVLTALFMIQRFFPTWMTEERGFETSQADMVFGVIIIGLVAGTLVGGVAADKAEEHWPDRGRAMASQLSILVSIPALASLVLFAYSLWVIIPVALVIAFFIEWTRRCALQPMIQNVMPPELRGTALALAEFFQGGVASILVIFLAFYSDKWSLDKAMLYGGCGCLALGFLVAFALYSTYPRDVEKARLIMSERRDMFESEARE
ncbi:MAG: MFS transporter [bacterium]